MKKLLFSIALFSTSSLALAHTPLLSCFDEGDGTVTCEGGFSDGSSASGVNFYVDQGGKKVIEQKFNELNTVNFSKPADSYEAVFDAGEGHKVIIKGDKIN